jgi:hypothetical protein
MIDKQVLRKLLIHAYSRDELKILAGDISGNDELVLSEKGTIEIWAFELISWCGRQNKIIILVDSIKRDRPDVYKEYAEKLEKKTGSQLDEIQTERKEIEEALGALKAGVTKKKAASSGPGKPRQSKHPLSGRQSSIHVWFSKLDTEQQVFVTAAALFSGLQRDELMSLYSDLLTVLGISREPEVKAED